MRPEYSTVVMQLGQPSYGNIDQEGVGPDAEEAAVPVGCNNGGGTAAGQLSESIVVLAQGEGGTE